MTIANLLPSSPILQTGSLPAQIHQDLEEAIISGRLEPGARLLAEELAERYGVSRIPVREAISSLQEAGWVDVRARYGVYVRARARSELAELFEARAGIESEIARLAAQRRTPEHVDALREIAGRSQVATERSDTALLSLAAVEFNAALRAASGNGVLSHLSLTLEKRARFYFSPVAHLLGDEWVEGQLRLAGLIESGDAPGSSASARRHIVETGDAVARLLPSGSFSD